MYVCMYICMYIYIYIYIEICINHHDFPTHPHYHGPGTTYFPGRYVEVGRVGPSTYFIQGAL